MTDEPSGAATFLIMDTEGGARPSQPPREALRAGLERRDVLVGALVERHAGFLIPSRGEDEHCLAVFARAAEAVAAAAAVQRALHAEPRSTGLPSRVRAALHTGEAEWRDGDTRGAAVDRCARLLEIAHGGQML